MSFLLKNIDRAIEWVIRDEMIKRNLWPAQRSFTTDLQMSNALAAMDTANLPKVDVFGVGNYTDREELKKNNLIISRSTPTKGATGYFPFRFEMQADRSYNKIRGAEGSVDIEYEVRFVAFNVDMDRRINEAMIKCMSNRKFLHGMNDDLSNMKESFLIERIGDPVDLSGPGYIERVFRYAVMDVEINEDEVVETGIPPMKQFDLILNVAPSGSDVQYPSKQNDVATVSYGVRDLFYGLVEDTTGWKKLKTARLYAQATQGEALKDLLQRVNDAVNTGLTFTPFKGFNTTGLGQFINTKFNVASLGYSALTNFCYGVFVTDVPASGIMELFGFIAQTAFDETFDETFSGEGPAFLLRNNSLLGFQAKGNSGTQMEVDWAIKPNTLYVLNRRDRFQMELFEGDRIIAILEEEPVLVTDGNIFDLNIGNQAGLPNGFATSGGIAFSMGGDGLTGSEIRELNSMIRMFMTRIGVIPS